MDCEPGQGEGRVGARSQTGETRVSLQDGPEQVPPNIVSVEEHTEANCCVFANDCGGDHATQYEILTTPMMMMLLLLMMIMMMTRNPNKK